MKTIESANEFFLDVPVEKVFARMTDLENTDWRSDVSACRAAPDGKSFVEYTKEEFETRFMIVEKKENDVYVLDLENKNMRGHFTAAFAPQNGGTRVLMTEKIQLNNPVMQLLATRYLKSMQARYEADLRRSFHSIKK